MCIRYNKYFDLNINMYENKQESCLRIKTGIFLYNLPITH